MLGWGGGVELEAAHEHSALLPAAPVAQWVKPRVWHRSTDKTSWCSPGVWWWVAVSLPSPTHCLYHMGRVKQCWPFL